MTSDEAQQAQDVVLGMFLTSSHPVTILLILEHLIHLYHQVLS
jgi:hypothetical protein